MKVTKPQDNGYVVTLAELCAALEDGRLVSQRSEGYYTVRQRDLRRFAQASEVRRLGLPRSIAEQLFIAG